LALIGADHVRHFLRVADLEADARAALLRPRERHVRRRWIDAEDAARRDRRRDGRCEGVLPTRGVSVSLEYHARSLHTELIGEGRLHVWTLNLCL
jgi:hypothetical protein